MTNAERAAKKNAETTTMIRGALDMLELDYRQGRITEGNWQVGTKNLLALLPSK